MKGKISEKNTNEFTQGIVDQVFCIGVQKSMKQLLITSPNSALFCQRFQHLLTS